MPNWCENVLRMNLTNKDLQDFIDNYVNDKKQIDFNLIIPQPSEDLESFDWYTWRCNHWGTKWNAVDESGWLDDEIFECILDGRGYDLGICFDTAWSPPLPIIMKLIELYPDSEISLDYYEPGCEFAGTYDECGDHPTEDIKRFAIEKGFCCEEDFEDEEEIM